MSAPSDHNAIQIVPVARLRAYANNVRTHSKRQIRQIADSIREFGFTNPVLISDDDEIIAGQAVAEARVRDMVTTVDESLP
jgi:ParB-like chromosome segregation protein Spo0J